jgi:hypothetical protein
MTRNYIQNTNPDFFAKISRARNDRSFADVCLRVGDREFFCHAFLLALQSDYFKAALDEVWIKKRKDGLAELDLSQFDEETMDSVIEYIYSGKVGFSVKGGLSKIAEAADFLLMSELFELCLGGLGEFSQEVVPMFAMAMKLGKQRVAVECVEIFPPDWNETKSIGDLDEEMIRFVILSMYKKPDVERWIVLVKWAKARCDAGQDHQVILLFSVCLLPTLTCRFLNS